MNKNIIATIMIFPVISIVSESANVLLDLDAPVASMKVETQVEPQT